MFPTNPGYPPPPGVFVSEDQSEVTSPLNIAEWLIGFHAEARQTLGCLEGICGEGEVLHVPSGKGFRLSKLTAHIQWLILHPHRLVAPGRKPFTRYRHHSEFHTP